jgi:hypothetical protein
MRIVSNYKINIHESAAAANRHRQLRLILCAWAWLMRGVRRLATDIAARANSSCRTRTVRPMTHMQFLAHVVLRKKTCVQVVQ